MIQFGNVSTLPFALCLCALGLFTLRLILQTIQVVTPHLESACTLEPLTFTHYSSVDQLLCAIVVFFQRAMDDYMGLHVTRVILGCFGTVQAIMAIEGSRNGYSRYHLISWFMLWGMVANVYTIAVVSSLMWVPLLVLTSGSFVSRIWQHSSKNISSAIDDTTIPTMVPPARSAAVLVSLVLMYGVPTFLMVTSLVAERGSWLSLQITSLWQFCPILIQVSYTVFTWIMTPLLKDDQVMPLVEWNELTSGTVSSSTTNNMDINRQRQRVRMAQSKTGVEQLYFVMLVINVCIYYGTFMQIQMDGVHLKDSLVLLATKTLPVSGLGELEINQFYCAYFLLLDLTVVTLTYALWSLYEDGVLVFLAVIVGIVVLGPGSSIAAYALYREQRMQDPRYLETHGKKTN